MDCEAKSVLKSVSGSPSEDWPSTSVHSRLNEKAIKRRRYEKKTAQRGLRRERKGEKRDPCENKTKRSDCRLFGV